MQYVWDTRRGGEGYRTGWGGMGYRTGWGGEGYDDLR